ncbi:CPA2 family monovalent cation:H+ antiporter-2/glutathione-regulated potassium-efflux system protein KefB [Altererythrobacter atlanticus]|uniref:Glutathione-regulated potassium-efflux system protein KefC n=1 Tax=Croceibacterium atlanticum TaxID=1267766 RepID=A0A0F7KST5_9SPHN|nr:cation:proton antiporter [Croceibacterium atlanticum]AKH42654.1 Glutathione-regulated potassium-efflux system protein KefC [Croceibacterium atlanticum]MBB5731431.1 CPA2 family monovalent cation:H+ antiporter-2/glutathione-regulated potassium-efflux system protein KefB [Croceibacterium atlanticum]
MEETAGAHVLIDGFILLGFALASVLLFRRMGLGATLGYLVAGALVGPQVLGLVGDAEEIVSFAELGIVLLLFIVGLELNPGRLWRMKREIFGLGLLQVALCGIGLIVMLQLTTSFTLAAAIALGLPLALSSTAQVLPMLQSAGRLRTPFGERAFAILLFQDLSIIPLITIVAALSRNPADLEGPAGWVLALLTVAALVGLIAAGRFIIRPLFGLIGGLGERELFVVAALFTVVAAAALMEQIGVSPALGAFVAGVMLSDTPYRHELEADVEPFRSILLGLFFLGVGMMLDLGAIAERPLFVFSMAFGLIAVKASVIFVLALAFKMGWRGALALGLLLSQGGEFGFVLFAQAQDALLIRDSAASVFGAVITLSMATTPFLMMANNRIRRPGGKKAEASREGPSDQTANALVVGYGRFGQTVAQTLMAGGIDVTLIDRDVGMIDTAREFGAQVYFGDGTRMDLLRQAGAAQAQVIMFCIDRDQVEPDLVSAMREHFPNAAIYVRAFDRRSVMKLHGSGAEFVMREVFESALRMARMALDRLGLSEKQIEDAVSIYRNRDKERLLRQSEEGDLYAARDIMLTQPQLRGEDADQSRNS